MDKIIDSNFEATDKKNELVAELQRVSQENQKLISVIKLVSSNYHSLQMQFMKHQEEYLRPSPRTMGKTLKLGLDVAEDINGTESFRQQVNMDYNVISSSSEETSGSSLQKNCKYTVDDSHLPSKKRKIKYVSEQSDSENWNSCTDEDLPNKEGSGLKTVAVHKKVVTVQTKLETTAVSEGRQWRKYGQKMTLNNPWPRAYYRCAMGPCCPVRKHVQRCAQDPSMVSTTYKGEHNHLMKPVAMAVMNCTATDQPRVGNCNQIPFPVSIATISSMGSSPTITLDLTKKPEGFVSQDSCSLKARLA